MENSAVPGLSNSNGEIHLLEDTQAKLKEVQNLVIIHSLLNKGLFPGVAWMDISNSLKYLEGLHAEASKVLEACPDYNLIPKNPKEGK